MIKKNFLRDVTHNVRTASGITLIALVVTIIVMVILLGVALNLIGGDNGVIAKAKWSAYVHEYESVDEQKEMYVASQRMQRLMGASKEVLHEYKVASIDDWAKTVDDKKYAYPVNEEMNICLMPATLRESIKKLEGFEESQLYDTNYVYLYKVDFSKINANVNKEYVINIQTGMLYSYQGEDYNANIYHTPRQGVDRNTIQVDTNITEPATYEFIVDADSIVDWESVELFYDKYVSGSTTCEFYTSDDQIEWNKITAEVNYNASEIKENHVFSSPDRTRYLKIVINVGVVDNDNSEIGYMLVNYHKYKKTDVTVNIDRPDATNTNVISYKRTVTQTFIVPDDGGSYISTAQVYGNPNITVKVENSGRTQTMTWQEFYRSNLPAGATVTVTAELGLGDEIEKIEILQRESVASKTMPSSSVARENREDWRTVKEKQFIYDNRGHGVWKKAYFNSTVVDSSGIIQNEEYKRIKITYQTSSDKSSWGGRFSDVQSGGGVQYLKVNVEYQVYGNREYGTIGNDKVIVLRDLDEGSVATVSFDPNGGTGTVNDMIVDLDTETSIEGQEISLSRPGYYFIGWSTTPGENQPVVYTDSITITGDMPLYAQWHEAYTIIFEPGEDGTGSMETINNIKEGESVVLTPNAFTRQYYAFDGWKDQTGKTYSDGDTVVVNSNLELTAQWRLNAYVWKKYTATPKSEYRYRKTKSDITVDFNKEGPKKGYASLDDNFDKQTGTWINCYKLTDNCHNDGWVGKIVNLTIWDSWNNKYMAPETSVYYVKSSWGPYSAGHIVCDLYEPYVYNGYSMGTTECGTVMSEDINAYPENGYQKDPKTPSDNTVYWFVRQN